jgi:hypothetical protein
MMAIKETKMCDMMKKAAAKKPVAKKATATAKKPAAKKGW